MSVIPTIARTGEAACRHRVAAGLCLIAAATLLSGCGGSSTGAADVVTVTVTPTITATAAPTSTVAATATATAPSDDLGRTFDLGTITAVQNGGLPVVILDRWTAQGVSDSALAAAGVPIHVHSDAPYQNLNSTITYRIPVAPGAVFTYRHCVAVQQPPEQRSSTLDEFSRLPEAEKVVLLTLNQQGQVVMAQNDPAC